MNATWSNIYYPNGVFLDSTKTIWIADTMNSCIKFVNSNNELVLFAGKNNDSGYSGDNGLATSSQLSYPTNVVVDENNNVYISDTGNNVIRKVDTSGIISTFAGTGHSGYSGDGEDAINAQLNTPQGIYIDSFNHLYIADTGNNVIRKVSDGIITTFAGTGESGYSGDNNLATLARLNAPTGLAVNISGNLFITDTNNNAIRMITILSNEITTIAGTGVAGYSGGDGSNANTAMFNKPTGITIDRNDFLFVNDTGNQVIRQLYLQIVHLIHQIFIYFLVH